MSSALVTPNHAFTLPKQAAAGLRCGWRIQDLNRVAAKELKEVVETYGSYFVLTHTYTVTGWCAGQESR